MSSHVCLTIHLLVSLRAFGASCAPRTGPCDAHSRRPGLRPGARRRTTRLLPRDVRLASRYARGAVAPSGPDGPALDRRTPRLLPRTPPTSPCPPPDSFFSLSRRALAPLAWLGGGEGTRAAPAFSLSPPLGGGEGWGEEGVAAPLPPAPGLPMVRASGPPRAPVAQLDRALPSEGRGRTFESCRVRHLPSIIPCCRERDDAAGAAMLAVAQRPRRADQPRKT